MRAPPPAPGSAAAAPLPEALLRGLPEEKASVLRIHLGWLAGNGPEVDEALRNLPMAVAQVPEDRRREWRAELLRRIEPFALRRGPRAGIALEAAAWILREDPDAEPQATRRMLEEGAAKWLRGGGDGSRMDLTSSVAFAARARGTDRAVAAMALKQAALDKGLPVGVRVLAVQAMTAEEMGSQVRALGEDAETHPALREAVAARGK
jgi:hypothetical protein